MYILFGESSCPVKHICYSLDIHRPKFSTRRTYILLSGKYISYIRTTLCDNCIAYNFKKEYMIHKNFGLPSKTYNAIYNQ